MVTRSVALVASLLAVLSAGTTPSPGTWTVDSAASHVTIHVGKTGLFGFAGHTHEIDAPQMSGTVEFDRDAPGRSVVHLTFQAGALRVNPDGEPPEDVPEVQRTMLGPDVLDVERHPTITFESTSIDVRSAGSDADASAGSSSTRLEAVVTGDLTLRGVTRPVEVTAEVTIDVDRLHVTGTCRFKQTDFGIEPVTAGLGTVRVKDELELSLDVVARPDRTPGT